MQRILATTPSGGVTVTTPSANAIAWMACGKRWGEAPRGWLEQQIEQHARSGVPEWAAARFVRAMHDGGLTGAEALAVIRDKDVRGLAIDLIDAVDLPDRLFRNAWRRSHNGGPVWIDIDVARGLRFSRLRQEFKQRQDDIDLPAVRWGVIRDRLNQCEDTNQMMRVGLDA